MSHATTAHIALGSNLGDRERNIRMGVDMLESHVAIHILRVSSIIETDPVGRLDQPRFLNAAAEITTELNARMLLQALLEIERACGRVRDIDKHNGPRTLDLDLLLYADSVVAEPGLTVPHQHMHERLFVLAPLVEIAPNAVHPVLGRSIESLHRALIADAHAPTMMAME